MNTKICSSCKENLPLAAFHTSVSNKSGYQAYCKDCGRAKARAWQQANPRTKEENRARNIFNNFGLTLEEYDAKFEEQKGKCKICGYSQPEKLLAVDHDHETGKLRDLLCANCNLGLGHFKDNTVLLASAIQYLEAHRD